MNPASKIFGIGLGRTGSVSLARALEQLGSSVEHYPGDTTKKELLAGHGELSILKNKQGLVDGIQPFYRLLDKSYPGSKFILTTREKDSFLRSRIRMSKLLKVLRPKMSPLQQEYHGFVETYISGTIDPDVRLIWQGYQRHVADVKHYFLGRPKDLLVMDIPGGDGWDKLCPFLSLATPEVPFPRSNSSEDIDVMTQHLNALWDELHQVIPSGTKFLFVDDAALGIHFPRHEGLPFPNRDGVWWGLPADSAMAVQEFEEALTYGIEFIAFAWTSFWWFDYYGEFLAYLETNHEVVIRNEHCVLFDCRS